MKRKLIAGLITLCAVLMTACSNKTSNDSADSTTSPVTESTNEAPTTQAAPPNTADDTQAQTSQAGNTDNTRTAQTSPTDSTDNTQTRQIPKVSLQNTPAPKNATDSTASEKTATDKKSVADKKSTTDKNTSTDTASENSSARTTTSQDNSRKNKLLIGKKKAKSIALKDAGLKKKKVHFTEAKLDYDNGRSVYNIEFYSRKKEYDYEIDATTGKILSRDWDKRDNKVPSKNDTANGSTNNDTTNNKITMKEAKQIALKSIGLTENDGRWKKAKLDKDDGRFLYELEFISGKTEHEFEIDANSGEILEYDKEPIR